MGSRPERCPAPFRAPAPFTCHEHHEDRAAPLGRRDGGRNGALEPQHLFTPASVLAGSAVFAARSWTRPRLRRTPRPRQPQLARPPPPAPQGRAHSAVFWDARKRAWRHVMPHVAVGREFHCLVWLASWRVRAPATP